MVSKGFESHLEMSRDFGGYDEHSRAGKGTAPSLQQGWCMQVHKLFCSEMSFPGSCLLVGAVLASTWFHGREVSGLLFSIYLYVI